ncbi:hypothetical protein Ae201684P_022352 [Aphanomyces euteiches]|uniref:Uncharacterized protein n=1 Tax=Aphanomyces euteiches TaxID=100861 RepID=A0A6G0X6J7_9STRA|nr:hypothetical protein Ae201684_008135 [Aphanomyces euteiches]KAH9074546.1 hypothetical protein Ae201684P_022352 [Aphanomyces euteiches]
MTCLTESILYSVDIVQSINDFKILITDCRSNKANLWLDCFKDDEVVYLKTPQVCFVCLLRGGRIRRGSDTPAQLKLNIGLVLWNHSLTVASLGLAVVFVPVATRKDDILPIKYRHSDTVFFSF